MFWVCFFHDLCNSARLNSLFLHYCTVFFFFLRHAVWILLIPLLLCRYYSIKLLSTFSAESINMTPAAANSTRQSTNHNCNLGCWFRRPLMSRKFCGCCSKDTLQQENFTGNCCLVTFSKPYVDDQATKHILPRKHQHVSCCCKLYKAKYKP